MSRTITLTQFDGGEGAQTRYFVSGFSDAFWADSQEEVLAFLAAQLESSDYTRYQDGFRERVLGAAEEDITLDADWVFWPTWNRGYYTAAALRVLADELDRRNEKLERDE